MNDILCLHNETSYKRQPNSAQRWPPAPMPKAAKKPQRGLFLIDETVFKGPGHSAPYLGMDIFPVPFQQFLAIQRYVKMALVFLRCVRVLLVGLGPVYGIVKGFVIFRQADAGIVVFLAQPACTVALEHPLDGRLHPHAPCFLRRGQILPQEGEPVWII